MTIYRFYDYLSGTTPAILLAGVVLGSVRFRERDGVARLIFWYFVGLLLLEAVAFYFGHISPEKNNLVGLSVNGLIHLLFFFTLYDRHYGVSNWPMRIAAIVGFIAVILNIVYYQPHKTLPRMQLYDVVISDAVVLVFALFSTFNLLSGKTAMNTAILRVNAIVLLYFSIDFLIALSMNFLINGELAYNIYFWLIRLVLLITLYLVLLNTLWQTGRNRKHSHYG